MLYKPSEKPFSAEIFKNPPKAYRGIPFWAWNCRVTREHIDRQVEMFERMGMGGAMIHPRVGMDVRYLSEEYMELVRYAVDAFKARGMYAWLYDEERFPSGDAGGIVTKNMKFRSRHLLITRKERPEMEKNRLAFDEKCANGEKPSGYLVDRYEVLLDENGCLKSYHRGAGDYFLYLEMMKESSQYNGETYVDVFNPDAIDAFLNVTHEKYREVLGKDFGSWVPAIFTDEPHMKGKYALPTAKGGHDATVAYSEGMDELFREEYGVSLLDVLPEILWELPDGRVSVNRYRYHNFVTERFARCYADKLGAWCEENGIAYTGHYLSERTLYSQTLALGETMRHYRAQQIPGVDVLADQKEFTTLKQCQSVARQCGREAMVSELYGVTHWDFDFKGHKLQGDWQAALGITVRVHHLSFMSMQGEAKRDWPASIADQSPWWEKYPYIENHFARVNALMTRGRDVCRVAVIHPIDSFHIVYGPVDQTQAMRDHLDAQFENLTKRLLFDLIDFDYISESMLPGTWTIENGLFRVGCATYSVVIVPDLLTVRATTLDALEAYIRAGGRVICLGNAPKLVDAEENDRAERLLTERLPFDGPYLTEALSEYRDIEIRARGGRRSDNLFYRMRDADGGRNVFICHVNRAAFSRDTGEDYMITLKGHWIPTRMDTLGGNTEKMPAEYVGENTVIKWHCFSEDSLLIRLEPGKAAPVSEAPKRAVRKIALAKVNSYALNEPNAYLLDMAEWALDGDAFSPAEEILRADDRMRAKAGLPLRKYDATQPWLIPQEETGHTARVRFTVESEEEFDVTLALEHASEAEIILNGRKIENSASGWYVDRAIETVPLGSLKRGQNEISVAYPLSRRLGIEPMYLLGDFAVAFDRLVKPLEKLPFGDITRLGLEYYTGNVDYLINFSLDADESDASIHVPHFACPVLEAILDGKSVGLIAFSPHRLALGAVSKGRHTLVLRAYGNRFNGFGTLHNANPTYQWYGPQSYRTEGNEWTDTHLVRASGILSPVELCLREDSIC